MGPADTAGGLGMTAAGTAGQVVAFGEDGWGTVRLDTGEEHPFHCTAITDGSRTIEVGTLVRVRVVPGRQGRWEATDLTPR